MTSKRSDPPTARHRIVLRGKYLRNNSTASDVGALSIVADKASASAWPIDRARFIARMFADATVDPVVVGSHLDNDEASAADIT